MKIQANYQQPIALRQPQQTPSPAPGPQDKIDLQGPQGPQPPKRSAFGEAVAESIEDCSHQGKKLGTLALVAYATSALPLVALTSTMHLIPDALFGPVAIGTMVGTMALASLEEKHIGIGKQIGRVAGAVVGAGVGVIRGAKQEIFGRAELPAKAEIARQMPGQAKPFRPLVQAGLDAALGPVQKRSKALELSELVGATASTLIVAYTVPAMIGNAIGGPVGNALATSLIGPLSGMVLGGLAESTLGIGRGAGELVGRAIDKLRGPQSETPPVAENKPKSEPGALKKGFLSLNNVIAQPIIGFLLDTTIVGNRLMAQKPIQSMHFEERPVATVNRERLVNNFVSLAGIYGPSGKEKLIGDELEKRLGALNASVKRHEDGTIVGTLPATPGYESSPTVMLSAHQDTVLPTRPEDIIIGERRIHTNEKSILGADDRAGIAEIFEGVESALEQGLPHPELKFVFPVDEERGLVGSSRLRTEDISTRPTLGYVVDALDVKDVHLTNDAVIVNPKSIKYNYSQDDPLVQVLYRSMTNAGVTPRPIPAPIMTGAGSDANTPAFNSGPIRSIAIGAGERDLHTTLEYIKTDHLEQAARHVLGVITNSCDLEVQGDQIVPKKAFSLQS
ncbi:M20/M25/M40 family metallo-hydrolase [bacterium]|nr:M20/M25/M40 family metallo-hydrolase [bacterium]